MPIHVPLLFSVFVFVKEKKLIYVLISVGKIKIYNPLVPQIIHCNGKTEHLNNAGTILECFIWSHLRSCETFRKYRIN